MQEYLHSDFKCEEHKNFLEDVLMRLISKNDGSAPTKRENFWMDTLEILVPYRLNVENGILSTVSISGRKSFFLLAGYWIIWIGYWTRKFGQEYGII